VRVDKWLWAARFYKTRSAATDAVLGGRVHINETRVKPAKDVRLGDEIELTVGVTHRVVEAAPRGAPPRTAARLIEMLRSAAAASPSHVR
jgi:ribosome-associated heat shock protein Hsp15